MSGPRAPRFDPLELRPSGSSLPDAGDERDIVRIAATLEVVAADTPELSAGFVDGVMAAVGEEPAPAPGSRLLAAVFGLRFHAAAAAVGDAWRTATTGPRPVGMRASAAAVVLAAVLGVGAIGTTVAVGAAVLFGPSIERPAPSVVEPSPQIAPDPTPSPLPEPTLSPSPSPMQSAAPSASVGPDGSAGPTDSAEPEGSDDHGGSSGSGGSGSGSGSDGTPEPEDTPKPTETPDPEDTPKPSETPNPDESDSPSPSDD